MEPRDIWKAKEVLKDMNWPQRIEYIWTYYRIPIIAFTVGIVLLVSILCTVLAPRKEALFVGTSVNVAVSEEGRRYLTDGLFAVVGGMDADTQKVELVERNLGSQQNYENYTSQVMSMVAHVVAQELDYALLDQAALEEFAPGGLFSDLRTVLTEEQVARFADKLYTITTEEGQTYPVAIDISDLPFVKDCARGEKKVYIAFPGNTVRAAWTNEFFDWLLAWEKD